MNPDEIQAIIANQNRIEKLLHELQQNIKAQSTPWLTVEEAARETGYSENHFREIMKREIPYFQRDRRQMVSRKDLEAWMARNKKTPAVTGANS